MSDITISYKGSSIATMDASGTKTLLTEGKYCEDDITVDYVSPGGGGISIDDIAAGTEPSGAIETSVSIISDYAFLRKSNITSYKDNTATRIGVEAFRYCTGLQSIECQNLVILGRPSSAINDTYSIANCSSLETIKFPKLEYFYGGNVFRDNGSSSHRITLVLPSIKSGFSVRGSYFAAIDLGTNLTKIESNGLYSATVPILILRHASIVTTGNADSLQGINSNTTVYIPKVLYDHLGDGTAYDYRAATNWSSKTTTAFACIEGSQYENYYADGTPIT